MSRIGNKHIDIPQGVEVKVEGNCITTKGDKGTLSFNFNHDLGVEVKDNAIYVHVQVMTKIIVHYMVQLVLSFTIW